jgi:hypothetical protein
MNWNFLTNEFFLKASIFFLVLIVSGGILKKLFYKQKEIAYIIALSIAILSSYYLTKEQESLLMQTSSLFGIIATISIPFIIVFFFIYKSNIHKTMRRGIWIFYLLLNIYLLRLTDLNSETITKLTVGIVLTGLLLLISDQSIKDFIQTKENLKLKKK